MGIWRQTIKFLLSDDLDIKAKFQLHKLRHSHIGIQTFNPVEALALQRFTETFTDVTKKVATSSASV